MTRRGWVGISRWTLVAAVALLSAPAEAEEPVSITNVTFDPPVQKETGGTVTVTISGQKPARAAGTVAGLLSLNPHGDPLPQRVECKTQVTATPPSSTFTAVCKLLLPKDLAPGSYYVVGAGHIGQADVRMTAVKQLGYR
jgi:hypothetical protein